MPSHTYRFTCPCGYEITRKTLGEGSCRSCGRHYIPMGDRVNFWPLDDDDNDQEDTDE